MTRNITLSADEHLIEQARQRATEQRTTLNGAFREWLCRYVKVGRPVGEYRSLMDEFVHVDSGRKFTRDELNAR